jgi:cytochrome oxidase Cu insertion factor (SCO1/SenC/PrrC family)
LLFEDEAHAMNSKLTAVAVAALIAGGAVAATLAPPTYAPSVDSGRVATTGKALVGGPFQLTDTTGRSVSEADFKGRYTLVFFGYTFCPDVCPSGLQVLSAALDQLGTAGAAITPVFITIDPARDTTGKMGAYLKSFHPRFVGLTGSPEAIAGVLKAYRVYARKATDDRDGANYTMDHSSIAYLMGPDGQLVAFAPEVTKPDVIADFLRKGLANKG